MPVKRPPHVNGSPNSISRLACGSLSGVVATVPMTVVAEVLRRALPPAGRDPFPPRRVAVALARKLGLARHMDRTQRESVTWAAHVAYGAGTGAGYGAVAPALREALPHPAAAGAAYGLAVWLLSYFGWLPAVGITSPQFRHPLRRNTTLVLSHLAWGITTGLLTARLTGPRPGRATATLPRHRASTRFPTRPPLPRKQSVSAT